MKKITSLFVLIFLVGCSTTQSNLKIDSVETFNLSNYNNFNIKINNSNIGAEVNPIVLERFKENLKKAIEERGLTFSEDSNIIFDINFSTKETVESDRMNHYYSRYYWDFYRYRDDVYNVTRNFLRVNLRDIDDDKTLWTVVTVWRDGSNSCLLYTSPSPRD